MSKIASALKKVSEERANIISPTQESKKLLINNPTEGRMRKSWFMGVLIVVGVVAVFIAFNYQGGKDAVPLSEIFPDEEVFPVETEYEFVQEETVTRNVEEVVAAAEETPAVEIIEPVTTALTVAAVKENALPKENVSTHKDSAFTVQIASFRNEKKALEALARIRAKVPSAYIQSRNLGEKGVWYRIYAGQYELRNDAEVALSGIKKDFNDSFIISPRRAK